MFQEGISFKEDHISQIPALQMLQKLGYEYLTPDEALAMRGGKMSNVLLEDVLRNQLRRINSIRVNRNKEELFSEQNIENGGARYAQHLDGRRISERQRGCI